MQRDVARHPAVSSYRSDKEFSRHWYQLLARASSGESDLLQVFSEIFKRLEQHLRFEHLVFALHDPARNVDTVLLQLGERHFPPEIPVLETSLGLVLTQQQSIEIHDTETETGFPDFVELSRKSGLRSLRVVPLTTDRRKLGVLAVGRQRPGPFSEADTQYLNHAVQLVALVLENALIADVLAREKAWLETLLDVNNALTSSLDFQNLFREISNSVRRMVQQDYTHLALHDKASDGMKFYIVDATHHPALVWPETFVPASECPAGVAFFRNEAMQFSHAELQSMGTEHVTKLIKQGVRSVCYFPLISRGKKLGALGFASLKDARPSPDDMTLLTQIAAQVAIAVDNASAFDEIAKFKDKLAKEKLYLEEEIRSTHNFGEVIGTSPALQQVLQQVEIAAPSDATVLVLGETGTGKELIARAVHRLSSRREGNFIKLNCAAIPTGLLESELFGHEKGAFTGAVTQKVGRLELADKGTLFLDEIGEIPMEMQPKLLRVLQDQEFERLGGVKTIRVNVRLVAATNRDLARAVADHQFRSDLFYRLNVFPITLPALRQRTGDIPMLVRYFVQKFARRMSKQIESIPEDIVRELEQWHWPGNIRELENFIERSVILTQGSAFFAPMAELRASSPENTRAFGTTLEEVEREYILRTLRESGGVIAGAHGAAVRLGMKRTTLQSRMQKLGIIREEYET